MKGDIRFKTIKSAFLAAAVLCLAFALCACGEAENTDIGAGSDASVADVTEKMLNSGEEAGAAQVPAESQTPEGLSRSLGERNSSWLSRCNQEKKGKAQSRRNRRLYQEMFVE
ncbi:MAG TPA: hypothetical protein H9685_00730 [Firmicutes bacterium]|nr:hypothetical protein [Bacillota bacterium]